jgi:alkanesulfonate monooxygenase SsuD/methylene tetrahydromethanopterin reductase-like flavin-dependent oxidoreductase (luciferase family)
VFLNLRILQFGWTWDQLEAAWRLGDRAGFDSASLLDLYGPASFECWTALSVLTARTEHIAAIPLVLAVPYRHPALVAKSAATLDQAAPGRVIVGLGAGGSPDDARQFGLDVPSVGVRVSQVEEQIEVMRLLWAGGGTYEGRYYQLDNAQGIPLPVTPGGPKVLVGGNGPRMLGITARHADIANSGWDLNAAGIKAVTDTLEAEAAKVGREAPAFWPNLTTIVGANEAAVEEKVAAWLYRRNNPLRGPKPETPLTAEQGWEILENSLVGDPDSVGRKLEQLEQSGIPGAHLYFADLPTGDGLELFASSVLPHLSLSR